MTGDRRAQEWIEIKKLEKDFFQEFQFVSGRVHKARVESRVLATQCGCLAGFLIVVIPLIYFLK